MINGVSVRRGRRSIPSASGLAVLVALIALSLTLAACGGTAAPSSPTAAAAAKQAPPTVAAAVPTVAAVATQVAPTIAAAATKAAPTVAAAATLAAPAVSGAATSVAGPAGTASATTAGQLADAGQSVYSSSCASCHGAQGQGASAPAVVGSGARFTRYQSAQDLLTYLTRTMPQGHPGGLTAEQYLQVTTYLLVQNNFVQRSASINSAGLGSISLTR